MIRLERITFTHKSDQTVYAAAQLMNKLPNGYTLVSFEYVEGEGNLQGAWIAICEGKIESVS